MGMEYQCGQDTIKIITAETDPMIDVEGKKRMVIQKEASVLETKIANYMVTWKSLW